MKSKFSFKTNCELEQKFDSISSFLIMFFLALILQSLFPNLLSAQDYHKSLERKLTPSPAVSALENYAAVELKKNTGGIKKSIPLLSITEGDITYSPSIEYFSTGIRVDDWGSRVGIGWTENLTAVISRTVKGLPDELAQTRTSDGYDAFGYPTDLTIENYNKIYAMALPVTYIDGEYDVYNYNIFGSSGSFIIKNGQALLIKDDNSVKITLNGAGFLVTNAKGYKYSFGINKETTSYSNENECDIDNPYRSSVSSITTAWFLDSIASPNNGTLQFHYSDLTSTYIYDFNDYWVYSVFHPAPATWCEDAPGSGIRTSCLRRKTTTTKQLIWVAGDYCNVIFDYVDRDDMYGEKLLKHISIFNGQQSLKEIDLNYKKTVANSSFETVIEARLINGAWEPNALRTRYFLESLKIGTGGSSDLSYRFRYLDPSLLPHRFSLSKDYMGCYNAQANTGLVPRRALESLNVPWDKSTLVYIPFANREPSLVGTAGLLSSIIYPTGGKDSIEYEQNRFKYLNPNNTVVDSVFALYRVKRVITESGSSPSLIKNFRYDVFTKLNDKISYADSSSMVVAPFLSCITVGAHVCTAQSTGNSFNPYRNPFGAADYPIYTVRDRPNYGQEIYGGLPYAYKYVTEYYDGESSSFVASEFNVAPNGYAYRDVASSFHPEMGITGVEIDNMAWDHGIELKRYTGGKESNQFFISKENEWSYSNSSVWHYNYSVYKAFEQYNGFSDMDFSIGHYVVKKYLLYRHWTKLDSVSEMNYFRKNGLYESVKSKTQYRYNSIDKQVEEKEVHDSNHDVLLTQTFHPNKMVDLGQDSAGIYEEMVARHIIAPSIKEITTRNGVQTGMVLTNYSQPFSGLFVPQTVVSQQKTTDPMRTRFKYLRYDKHGNVLSASKDGGMPINYLYSYKGKYPVMKIAGVDYVAIENILSAQVISDFSDNDGIDGFNSTHSGIRNQLETGLPFVQLTSYSYLPLIGLRREVDPKGSVLLYWYDDFNRLQAIQGSKGVIKTFDYHYKED